MNKTTLNNLPTRPGCYLFKNQSEKIIYIGKAKNIKQRVKSYFNSLAALSPAKQLMVKEIFSIETVIVNNETEALLLENNLIKKHQPKYNIDLKDDKNFCYVKISQTTPPTVTVERQIKKDNATYFGPYLSALAVRKTLNMFWPIGTKNFLKKFSNAEHQLAINQIKDFFRGNNKKIINQLQTKMIQAAKQKNYELAAIYRDRLSAIEKISRRQKIIGTKLTNQDIVSIFSWRDWHAINLFRLRQGKIIDKLNFTIASQISDKKFILAEFIQNYYQQTFDWPKEIVTPVLLPKIKITDTTKKIILSYKKSGRLGNILKLGQLNAQDYLAKKIPSFLRDDKKNLVASINLAEKLPLPNLPQRIECYDISNIQGHFAVGAMVVFKHGQPDKSQYRKFKIKYTPSNNDFAMIAEIIARRFTGHNDWPQPDLIIIDGGKGQLSSATKTLRRLKINLPIIALAKKNEDIFFPGKKHPHKFKNNSPELKLLQRIRDEAHRFAINYYRQMHQKNNFS